jgi:hypothetical protein
VATAQHLTGAQWGVMNETGSYPGQPWLWLYTLWYQVPGFDNSANVDLIAIYLTGAATILLLAIPFLPGLRDIPRLIPVHRLIWRDWDRPRPWARRQRRCFRGVHPQRDSNPCYRLERAASSAARRWGLGPFRAIATISGPR